MLPTRRSTSDFNESTPFERLVLGTVSLGGLRGPVDRNEAVGGVLDALRAGVTRIDTAPLYAEAEFVVGAALAQWDGPKPWISTKVGRYWNAGKISSNYDPDAIPASVDESCRRLGVTALDCLFLHEPSLLPVKERPAAMAKFRALRAAGRVHSFGLGGGQVAEWQWFLDTGDFSSAISFNRLSAATSEALDEDAPALRRANVALFAASLLHAGLLGDRADIVIAKPPALLSAQTIANAAKLHLLAQRIGCTIGSLAHRFALSVREIDFLIIGAANRRQLAETLAAIRQGPLDQEKFGAVCACQE